MLTEFEHRAVMGMTPEERSVVWLGLLIQNRVDIDYIRAAEGLDTVDALRPEETDDEPPTPALPDPDAGLDLLDGAIVATDTWLRVVILTTAMFAVALLAYRRFAR